MDRRPTASGSADRLFMDRARWLFVMMGVCVCLGGGGIAEGGQQQGGGFSEAEEKQEKGVFEERGFSPEPHIAATATITLYV